MNKPAKFRKKPVVIEAIQWLGTNWNAVCDFAPVPEIARGVECADTRSDGLTEMPIEIKTLEGTMTALIGDWIIKGIKGEFYPCKDEIFRKTYEPVDEVGGVTK